MNNGTTADPANVTALGEMMMRGETPKQTVTDISEEVVDAITFNAVKAGHSERVGMVPILRDQSPRIAELEAALMQCKENASGPAMMPTSVIHTIVDSALIPSNPTPEPTAAMFGMGGDNDDF